MKTPRTQPNFVFCACFIAVFCVYFIAVGRTSLSQSHDIHLCSQSSLKTVVPTTTPPTRTLLAATATDEAAEAVGAGQRQAAVGVAAGAIALGGASAVQEVAMVSA
jgi:hypothetical protein